MGRCVIFGAAEFDSLLVSVEKEDYLIAADGGVRHMEKTGLLPDCILGDFDSLGYVPEGAQVFPAEKDDTDILLALRHGLSLGYRDFFIYGGLDGKRLDHTLANFQALAFLRSHSARGYLVGRDYLVTAISGETAVFPADADGILSVFCMGADATVTISGMKYNAGQQKICADFPLGVSNHFIGTEGKITASAGTLLLLWDRKNGLPRIG
ncbi:MAG: thiamine diphosphokinase [Ruminococcaceae bacterium]|nr:thiamine diphosphokinase [Oscillospiraceae bacterium]